jgi:transcriptional regulator with XRE-family HTH domain
MKSEEEKKEAGQEVEEAKEGKSKLPYQPRKSRKIDVPQALSLRYQHHLSDEQIAKFFNCSKNAVSQRLKDVMKNLPSTEELELFRQAKGDLMDAAFFQVLMAVTDPEKLEKASLNNAAYAVRQLYEMIRLEQGKSTANFSMVEYFARIRERVKEAEAKEEALPKEGADTPPPKEPSLPKEGATSSLPREVPPPGPLPAPESLEERRERRERRRWGLTQGEPGEWPSTPPPTEGEPEG